MIQPCNKLNRFSQKLVLKGWSKHKSLLVQIVPGTEQATSCSTHWGRVTHICVSKLTMIGSDNGLSPGRRQAIIWTNAVILLFGPLGTNFSEILIEIYTFSFKKMHLKMSSGKWWPFCLGHNVLKMYDCLPRCVLFGQPLERSTNFDRNVILP